MGHSVKSGRSLPYRLLNGVSRWTAEGTTEETTRDGTADEGRWEWRRYETMDEWWDGDDGGDGLDGAG